MHPQGPGLLQGAYDESEAASSFQEALQQWRQGSSTGSSAREACTSSQAETDSSMPDATAGSSCSLLHGAYDERAAASSFQEAVRQWRQAGPAGDTQQQGSNCTAAAQLCVQQQHSSTSTAVSAAACQGPTSQRPINSSFEAFLQKLTARTAVTLPPAGSYCNTVPPVEPSASQGAAGTGACTPASAAAAAASVPAEQSAPDLVAADDAPDTDAACDDDDCSRDADSSWVPSAPFDVFLEQAQEAAALLAAAAACGGTSSVQDTVGTAGSDGTAAGRTVAVSAYHQQLDSMLQAVEQLESQLEQRAKPVRVL